MITGRSLIWVLVSPVAIAAAAYSQAKDPDEVAPFPHPVAFTVSLDRSTFETREPVIARVTLTNLGDRALRLLARDGGAPRRMALEVSRGDGPYTEHSLWLERNGPQAREIELGKGESTSGDILLLLDYGKEYVFPEAGRYHLRWNFYPGTGSALVYTDEVQVRVIPSSRANEDFLDQLELVALRYHVGESADNLDLTTPEAEKGLDREGVLLLGQIIRQQAPHLIDPERNPDGKREVELVESLTKLFERHPESSYSAYVARFLGFAQLGSLDKKMKQERRARMNSQEPQTWDPAPLVADPAYQNAQRYLTIADEAELWNRTSALAHLAGLHVIAQEWDKVQRICDKLRTEYADLNGVALADEFEKGTEKRKRKIARWKKSQLANEEE